MSPAEREPGKDQPKPMPPPKRQEPMPKKEGEEPSEKPGETGQ